MFKRIFLFFLAVSLLAAAVVSRHHLIQWGVGFFLNAKAPMDGGWRFGYKELELKKNGVVFKGVSLRSTGGRIESSSEAISIVFTKREGLHFHGNIAIQSASVRLDQSDGRRLSFPASSGSRWEMEIDQASILLVDFDRSTDLYLSLSHEGLRLSQVAERRGSRGVLVKFDDRPLEKVFDLEVEEADAVWMTNILSFFRPDLGKGWEIAKGRVGGRLLLSLKENGVVETTAAFTLSDLLAIQERKGLEFKTEELAFDLSYPKFSLKSRVSEGKLAFKDPATKIHFSLCDLNGAVNFNSFKDAEIELRGNIDYKGEVTPIVLSGLPSLVNRDTLDIDFKVLLDPEWKSVTHFDLSIAMDKENACIIRGALKDLGIEQMAMFQHVIGFGFPEIRDFQLHSGKVACEISLRLQEGKMHKLKLDNLVADDIEIYWQSRDALGFCSHLEGSAQLDFLSLAEFQLPTWQVNLIHGDLIVGGKKPINLSDISLHLFMCRDVFEPSWITATYEGVEARLGLVGYYKEADITLGLNTNGERLLTFLGKEGGFRDYGFAVDLDFQRKLGYWDVAGKVKMDVRGEWEDEVSLSWSLSDRILNYNIDPVSLLKESISKGTFKAENISCEFMKFIEAPWLIEGIVSLEGNFDVGVIDGRAKSSYLHFSSPYADVAIRTETEATFHLEENNWHALLPLHNVTVFEKFLEASFYDTDALLTVDGREVHLEKIKTEVEGLSLEGDVSFDFRDSFKMKVVTNSVIGTVKQLEKFAHHIKELSLPFDGKVTSGDRGIVFTLDEEMDVEVHMSLVHGSYTISDGVTIHDLGFDFDGVLSEKEALFSNITGKVRGYSLNGREIHLAMNPEAPRVFFDVRLENQTMDLVRLAGALHIKERRLDLEKELSHFFGAKLKEANILLLSNGAPEHLFIDFELPCRDILAALRFCHDFDLMSSLFDALGNRTLGGVLTGKIEANDDRLSILLGGREIEVAEQKIENFKLEAERKGRAWHIKHLSCDKFRAEAKIDGRAILEAKIFSPMGEAHFHQGDVSPGKIHLPIEKMRVDTVDITGAIDIEFEKSIAAFGVRGLLGMKSDDFGKGHIAFRTKSDVTVEYSLDRGLVIQDAKVDLEKDGASVSLVIPTIACNLEEKIFQGYRIQANLTKEAISYLNSEIPYQKGKATPVLFDFEWSPEKFQIGGLLEKGIYVFRDKELPIEQMSFQYDQKNLDLYFHTLFIGKEIGVNLKVHLFDAFETHVEAYEINDPEKQVLLMDCRLKDRDGLSIQKVEGGLFGVEFHLHPMPGLQDDYSMVFMASAKLDMGKVGEVVTGELKDFITELKVGKGYELQGELTLVKEDWKRSFFDGYLKGRDFDFLGYQFRTLLSKVHMDSEGSKVRELTVSDNAVTATIPNIKIDIQPGGVWHMQMAELRIDNLRPSLLQKPGQPYHQRLKPFNIKQIAIFDIQGNLADMNTFTGKGHLNFVNTFKKGPNLLDIPIEIISRLGLDMVLLVPIQGEMDFVVKNGKAVFTKLKNSFSESKRSYFYLWNEKESYVDFDGNLNIDIRMKQYVLFKITELFVLSVTGTLEQPRFALK